MPTLAVRHSPFATGLQFNADSMQVSLADGRELSVPLEWLPRLRDATPEQRRNWRLIGRGEGVHWAELDEDVSVNGLLGLAT